jgi:beta-glucuronidase
MLKKFAAAFMLLVITAAAPAADFMENVYARKHTLLNGNWQYIVDMYETGFYDYRRQEDANGFFRNYIPADESGRVEYSFEDARELRVPGDWNSQDEKLHFYEGTIWYKKDFDYKLEDGKRLFLYFGAVNYESYVYLNGTKLGRHEGGFTPFQFEITDLLRENGNFVVVRANNERRADAVPTLNTDWWNFGGITRDVMLIETENTFVSDYDLSLSGEGTSITGHIKMNGNAVPLSATISIEGLCEGEEVLMSRDGEAKFVIEASPERWSPENPKLYNITITAGESSVSDKIGFRSIEAKGNEILLNGKSVFLRGICIHEQAPLRQGRAATREEAQILLGWAKELGCNFVRLAHYPHNEHMIRLAEEMGLLLWSENPVYWTIQWDNPQTYALAERQLDEMISRDKNRAAVIIWSMSNETPVTEARLKFLTALSNKARELDNTRLISAALEKHYKDNRTIIIDDPFGKELDVVGVNEYVGWYDGTPEKCDSLEWEMIYDKPMIISEYGGGALFGKHGTDKTMWSEEYQSNLYKHQFIMLDKIPFLRGTTPWILADFQSPRRLLPKIQDGWNRKGLISEKGERKQAFYDLQEYYKSK